MLTVYTHQSLPDYLLDFATIKTQQTLPESGVYLFYDETGLSLGKVGQKGKVQVDFMAGAAHYRRTKGGGELIAKAVQHTSNPLIWDATGGLGRDSWVLASQGLSVHLFEQHLAVYALLYDGLARAFRQPEIAQIAANITLHYGDASEEMGKLAQQTAIKPDVVYLDPMYPERKKSAAVKKEMAYFHELVGQSEPCNDEKLFQAALIYAQKRVVVKRPRLGEYLCQQKPAYQYLGKSTRFDVYHPNYA